MGRGPKCTTAFIGRERAAKLTRIGGRPARQVLPHQNPIHLYEMRCGNGSKCNPSCIYWYMWSDLLNPSISRAAAGEPASASASERTKDQRIWNCIGQGG